jgi:hypothetical protein
VVSASLSRFVNLGVVSLGGELVTRVSGHDAPSDRGLTFSYAGADVELRIVLRI